jgi:hypothetical protein
LNDSRCLFILTKDDARVEICIFYQFLQLLVFLFFTRRSEFELLNIFQFTFTTGVDMNFLRLPASVGPQLLNLVRLEGRE